MSLCYRPDWPEARERLTAWWHGADLGRPAMLLTCPATQPWGHVPAVDPPCAEPSIYTTKSVAWRANVALRSCLHRDHLGEAVPHHRSGDVGPGAVALYLGATAVEAPDTVWFEPCLRQLDPAALRFDPDNFYWQFTNQVLDAVLPAAAGRFLQHFPDLIEGLDILAAMRGTQELLLDLMDRPEQVAACVERVTDLYFAYYDRVYQRIRDEVGGSVFWVWGPGRTAKLQCDFSAMISPGQFRDLMLPVLREQTARIGYTLYHLDGVAAMRHVPAILELADLDMVQWTAGAGQPPPADPTWYPLIGQVLDAGKSMFLVAVQPEHIAALRRQFGAASSRLLLQLNAPDRKAAEALLLAAER